MCPDHKRPQKNSRAPIIEWFVKCEDAFRYTVWKICGPFSLLLLECQGRHQFEDDPRKLTMHDIECLLLG